MKIYRYSFFKVFANYWLVFCIPLLAGYAVLKIGLPEKWSWVVLLPIILTLTFLSIPLIMIFILLKTEIHINEREIIKKSITGNKTMRWEDVSSIERKNIYTIYLDKPRDFTITATNNKRIYIYGFLRDIEDAEKDIIHYSKNEIGMKGK